MMKFARENKSPGKLRIRLQLTLNRHLKLILHPYFFLSTFHPYI
jgi:hypothetical protein